MQLSIAAIALAGAFFTQASAAPTTAPQVSRDHEVSSKVLAVLFAAASPEPSTVPNCGYPTVPLLRAWSQAQTDHIYTTNATEMNAFLANGYTSQGIAAYILPSDTQAPTAVPLFRLYDSHSTDHYYTANATDRDRVVNRNGYVSEGVAGYVYADEECGTVPLYRLFGQGGNFFTADEAEVHDYVEQFGFENLGVTAYVNPQ